MAADPNPTKGRLVSHFENRPTQAHGEAWSDLWDSGDSGLWDREIPSPALVDLLEGYRDTLLNPSRGVERQGGRKRALVPGCGRGYDVVSLALHGFDAYGLEISSTAVATARKFAEEELASPRACNFGENYTPGIEPGEAHFTQGDFFDSAWLNEIGIGDDEGFDLVYDYTFLCALHPNQRPEWAKRMAEVVRPRGMMVCLEFPMYKDPKTPGPPWGVNGVHWELLAGGDEGDGMFTRKVHEMPERTFEVGRGTDMISVYERKSNEFS